MQGRTTETLINQGKIYESAVIIISATFDGVSTHTVSVHFTRPELNTEYGSPSWHVGIYDDADRGYQEGRRMALALTRLIKAASQLPRKWTVSNSTGRRIKVNF